MAHHRIAHPTDLPGCFGCQTLGVGFQGLQSRHGADPVQRVPVKAEEGRAAGKTIGAHHVHWDGRQDARVLAPTVVMKSEEQR
jgi:hypothetical protein